MLDVRLEKVIEKAKNLDKAAIDLLCVIAKECVKNCWHSLEDDPDDLPERDGLYECRVLMKDGSTRIASKVSYRRKPKIIYYVDERGVTRKKVKPSGWRTSGNFAWRKILEWRNRYDDDAAAESSNVNKGIEHD